jgi:hypothetical protein
MRQETGHASWWVLYLLGMVTIGLLALGAVAHLSVRGHEEAAIGTVLLVCIAVELWLRGNTRALLRTGRLTPVQKADPPDRPPQ